MNPDPNPFPKLGGMPMMSAVFWRRATERAVKTAAQTMVALIGTSAVSIIDVDWGQVAGVSATAAALSILTSVASSGVGDPDSPALVD